MKGPDNRSCALVLSGGSIKGAFQVGAIRVILEHGWMPTAVYGVSVGALNGAFVVDRAGRQRADTQEIDWPRIGNDLVDFWLKNIRSLRDIGKKRSILSLLWGLVGSRFNGLIDTSALHDMVEREIDPANLRRAAIIYTAGYVDMNKGELLTGEPGDDDILDEIVASTAIPVIMPPSLLFEGDHKAIATDGGVRDVAPFSRAIHDKADEIIAVLTQPEKMQTMTFKHGNLVRFAQRLMDIIVNETVNNDLRLAERVNRLVQFEKEIPEGHPFHGARAVRIKTIRPDAELNIDLDAFTPEDIKRVIEIGEVTAERELGG